jgi:hypothetical protein
VEAGDASARERRGDSAPRRYGPKGRRSGGAHIGGDGGEDLGAIAGTACRARYGSTGRRSGSARVGAASGTTWSGRPRGGGDRGLQHYGPKRQRSGSTRVVATVGTTSRRRRGRRTATLQPVGATQRRRRSRGSHLEVRGGGAAARRGDAAAARCSIGSRRVLGDVLGGNVRRSVDQADGSAVCAMAGTTRRS